MGALSGFAVQDIAEIRAVEGPATTHAYAANRTPVRSQLQRYPGPLQIACEPGARRYAGRPKRQFRYRHAITAWQVLHERRCSRAARGSAGETELRGHDPGSAGRSAAVLFGSE